MQFFPVQSRVQPIPSSSEHENWQWSSSHLTVKSSLVTFRWIHTASLAYPKRLWQNWEEQETAKTAGQNIRKVSPPPPLPKKKKPPQNNKTLKYNFPTEEETKTLILPPTPLPHPPPPQKREQSWSNQTYLDSFGWDTYYRNLFVEGCGWGVQLAVSNSKAASFCKLSDLATLPAWIQSHRWWQICRKLPGSQDLEVLSRDGYMLLHRPWGTFDEGTARETEHCRDVHIIPPAPFIFTNQGKFYK